MHSDNSTINNDSVMIGVNQDKIIIKKFDGNIDNSQLYD